MLKLNSTVFYPIKDDTDFKVTLRPFSLVSMQEVKMAGYDGIPSGGPQIDTPEIAIIKTKATIEFTKKVLERGVRKIEGMIYDDKNVETWQDLLEYAPPEVCNTIVREILKLSGLSDTEIKN